MSDYIVSARKYRPDSFESLIGQDTIARTLKNSIARNQLAHAYLFCGPRGVGKTSTARIFAKAINCSNPGPDYEPCGECESCRSFKEGRSYCIHELDAASNNSVDDIRTLTDQVRIPPQVGKYGVYIIDEVHMLSQSAFNAFLKVLEEPPAHAIFILATTEKHKILPTILSRCQTYDFNRIGVGDIVRNLKDIASKEGITADEESLHVIARKADGAMRDALTIFDQTVAFCGNDIHYEDVIRNLNVLDYEYSFRLVDAFLSGDYASALLIFDEVLAKGFNALYFVSALGSHLRDLLVSRTAGLDSLLDYPDQLRKRFAEQASRCSVKFIYDALTVTTQCEAGYKASANQRLHIEYSLMRLSFLQNAPDTAASAAPAASPKPSPAPKTAEPAPAPKPAEQPKPAPKPAEPAKPAEAEPQKPAATPAPEPTAPAETATPVKQPEPAEPEATTEPEKPAEPAATTAPEKPAEEPAPAPRRRPTAKGGAALSMSSILKDSAAKATETADETGPGAEVSEEVIREKWSALAGETAQPRLANALANAKLEFGKTDDGAQVLQFSVTNEAQKKWIEEKMLFKLEGRMRDLCASSGLRLRVSVLPDNSEGEGPRIYLPEEKAADLQSRHPEVKNLISDLSLDIK